MFRRYTVSEEAKKAAEKLGLVGAVEKRLEKMAKYSAMITHSEGNCRYGDYILLVEDGVIKDITLMMKADKFATINHSKTSPAVNCIVCKGTMEVLVYDECEKCEGDGCSQCEEGQVPVYRPCPKAADPTLPDCN